MALAMQSADCFWSAMGAEVMISAPCLGWCDGSEEGNCRGMFWCFMVWLCQPGVLFEMIIPGIIPISQLMGIPVCIYIIPSGCFNGCGCCLLVLMCTKYLLGKGTSQGSSKFSYGSKTLFLPCVFPALILITKDDTFWGLLLHFSTSYLVDKKVFYF